jgi:hypothetical protein
MRRRLHKSSLLVAVLAAIVMARLVIPGLELDYRAEAIPSQYDGRMRFDHGWPLTYMERFVPFDSANGPAAEYVTATFRARWAVWVGERRDLQVFTLIADACLATAIIVGVAAAWERRRRRRAHAWQLRISEMLLLVSAAAATCGWLSYARNEWQQEQDPLRALSRANAPYAEEFGARFWPVRTPCAPEWLVRLLGPDALPECLWRCTRMDVNYDSDQAYDGFADAKVHLKKLKNLSVMVITAPSRRHAIPFDELAELSQLRVLDLGTYLSRDEVETWQVLPEELERLPPLDRLVLPLRANLGPDAEHVVRTRLPQCEILFSDDVTADAP